MISGSVACVIVHHNNFPDVLATVSDVIAAGVQARHVMIVDNSESKAVRDLLVDGVPPDVLLKFVENAGYAAAVNVGIRQLASPSLEFVLVLTHEVRMSRGCVDDLMRGMDADHRVAAIGPVLTDAGSSGSATWSVGGRFRTALRIPRHHKAAPVTSRGLLYCDWLDGAAVLYRWRAVEGDRLHEGYFMYFEEVDFHARLAACGWRVAVALEASATQSSSGTPPFLFGRNFVIFQFRTGTTISTALAFVYPLVATLYRCVRRQQQVSALGSVWLGIRDGYRWGRSGTARPALSSERAT